MYGAGAAERRAWAEEAQRSFSEEGALCEISPGAALDPALLRPKGVVFIPDVAALSFEAQRKIVRCLAEREERPKLVLGLGEPPAAAVASGRLRTDLAYRLAQAQVDLSVAEAKDAIRARREKAQAEAAKRQPPAPKKKLPAKAKKR